MVDFQGVPVDDDFPSCLFDRAWVFFSSSSSTSVSTSFLHSFFGVIVLFPLSFISGWGVQGSTRAIVMRFFYGKMHESEQGIRVDAHLFRS